LAGRTGITFELGCGHGHWLAAYAAAHPAEFCVGIDLITHRVERSVRKQTLGKLDNVIFLKAEATEFLEALPVRGQPRQDLHPLPRSVAEEEAPQEPLHQRRQPHAARLTRPRRRPLHFRTDNADYFGWTGEHLAAHPQWEVEPDVTWPFEQKTFFEERMKDRRDVFARRAD
jgi:tRNA (guanine-N7-)-methyltransferase